MAMGMMCLAWYGACSAVLSMGRLVASAGAAAAVLHCQCLHNSVKVHRPSSTPTHTTGQVRVALVVLAAQSPRAQSCFIFLCMQELFDALQQRLHDGQPGYYKASYKIKENKFFHIPSSKEEVRLRL